MFTRPLRLLALATLAFGLLSTSTGCGALIDASFRESKDHGSRAEYHNRNFGQHFIDSLRGKDSRCSRCHHHHCCCD